MTDYLYRYEDKRYAPTLDEFDRVVGRGSMHIVLRKFPVLKRTPKGVWIDVWGTKKFVLESARKRYATASLTSAKESFIARKERQLGIHESRAACAREALRKAEKL